MLCQIRILQLRRATRSKSCRLYIELKKVFAYMCQRSLRRRTPRRVSFAPLLADRTFTMPLNKWYSKSWKSWKYFQPEGLYFAGAVPTAISREHQGRMRLRAALCSARPPAEAETTHAAISKATKDTRTTKRTTMQDKLFACPKLTLTIQQREAEIDSLLHELEHKPHPSLSL